MKKTAINVAIIVVFVLSFDVYLYLLCTREIQQSTRRIFCYAAYSLLLVNIVISATSNFIRPVDRAMIISSAFILIYTFVTIAFNYLCPMANVYLNLMAFDTGILISIAFSVLIKKLNL